MKQLHPPKITALKNFSFSLLLILFLTFSSNTSYAQSGQALQFDGVDDYINLPFIFSGSYTKEAWINTNTLFGFPNVLSGDQTTGTALFLNNGQLAAGHGPAFTQLVDPTPLIANTWYHVAVTFNAGTGAMNLYKNGVVVATATANAYTETFQEIGRFAGGNVFSGNIDEVRVWNVERTPAEILATYNCSLSGAEPGLIAYYNFDEGIAAGNNINITTLNDLHGDCPLNGQLQNFALTGATSNWITPGGVSASCTVQVPNISIAGNNLCIQIGDATPSVGDNTDFGITAITTNIDHTFTLYNNGGALLTITSLVLTGSADFTVLTSPAPNVAPGDSTTFTLRFIPATTGVKNAVVTINNDDADEATYSFNITGTGTGVVPVTLLNFKVQRVGNAADLTWQTVSELNNAGFAVQRINQAGVWETIGYVKATNISSGSRYSFTDVAPVKGLNTYRLLQTDTDGRTVVSRTETLSFDGATFVTIYPNPVRTTASLVFNDAKYLNSEIRVSTTSGVVVAKIKLNNSYRQVIDLGNLPKGLYIISFNDGSVQKIMKL